MEKIHMVQEVVLVVQNVLEELANTGERIKKYISLHPLIIFASDCFLFFLKT